MNQPRLPGADPPLRIYASRDRRSPAIWVRRLRVLKELKPGEDQVVRDVELRRGLNIVWAPPRAAAGGNGLTGHTAGKTTFCRLLRYVLGERSFATDATRRRIREKLPSGWVLADVLVEDEGWLVARPFAVGPHSFAVRGGSFAQTTEGRERQDYDAFLETISAATIGKLSAAQFPASDQPLRWEHVLPWLSRDQECRFADFLEWRHSSSDSESPSLNVDERQFVIRSMLGLISDDERLEQRRNAELVEQKKDAAQNEPLFRHQALTDHARVAAAMGMELAPPSTPLFGTQARSELGRRREALGRRAQDLAQSDHRPDLQEALESAVAAESRVRAVLEDKRQRRDLEQALLQQLEGDELAFVVASSLQPAEGFCNVRMSEARERGCPLAVSRPADFEARRSERTAKEELEEQRRRVQALEAAVAGDEHLLAVAQEATSVARRAFLSANTAFDEERAELLEERARLLQVERLVVDAEEAWRRSSENAEAVERIAREIDDSYSRQEQLRRERRDAMDRFSNTFDSVIRAILGDGVRGWVGTSGRSLSLGVEEHGDRDSAAIATVKLLAFDLSAMIASAEGPAVFPRLLIHDGPREADLSLDIYERLFQLLRELETSCNGTPSFQYIITTTTPPPEALRAAPWLILTLSGAPADERFLRQDL